MQLTETQQASVRQWAAQGAGLSEIQNRLAEEFGLRLSFMDVRLLMLELDVVLREKRAAPPEKKPAEDVEDDGIEEEDLADEDSGDAVDSAPGDLPGGVSVEISRLAQPGLVLNGDVTFSDGVKAQWGITSRGELSLVAADPAYRPSREDLQDFQRKLHRLVSAGQGY